jgi:outer membrane protein
LRSAFIVATRQPQGGRREDRLKKMATDGIGFGGRRPANFRSCASALLALALVAVTLDRASAESLMSALARAYYGNPDLNQSRANVRVRDEDAPKAKAGLRPKASITAQYGAQYAAIKIPFGGSSSQQAGAASGASGDFQDTYVGYPRGATLNLSQTLFDGFRTENSVRQAESGVFAARSTMRLTEQATLQNGATAYMNVLRDTAVLSLRKNNITVLDEQLKQTRDRFQVGEVTRTDVAQAEASVALARSEFYAGSRVDAQFLGQHPGFEPI